MQQSEKPSIKRKGLAYKSVTSLHKYIKTTDINKYNILYVAFDASFLLLLPTYLFKF